MTHRQILKFNVFARLYLLLLDNDVALMLLLLYPPLKTRFVNGFNKIYAAMIRQRQIIGGITIDKKLLLKLMVAIVYHFQLRAKVQAEALGLTELYNSFNKKISYLSQGNQETILANCEAMLKLMSDHTGDLTVLLPADITQMEDAISDLKTIAAKPIKTIKDRKAATTDIFPKLFTEQDKVCNLIANIIESFMPAELFTTWTDERKQGESSGVRHLSFVQQFLDFATGVPLSNVKVTLTDGIKTYVLKSSKQGYVRKYSLTSGNYTSSAEYPTHDTLMTENIGISDDVTVKITSRLKKL